LQLTPTDRDWLEWLAIRRWPSRVLPTYSMPWDDLIGDLMRQALFVRLHRSFAQTMASVSASRLAAMDTARRNIEERRVLLQRQHQHLRHTQITEELLDVVSGFESIEGR
jgi:F-type H+-transporting ATPase subunit gamma